MKTNYSLELWDLCGTSYGPFPLDAPAVATGGGVWGRWSRTVSSISRIVTAGHLSERGLYEVQFEAERP